MCVCVGICVNALTFPPSFVCVLKRKSSACQLRPSRHTFASLLFFRDGVSQSFFVSSVFSTVGLLSHYRFSSAQKSSVNLPSLPRRRELVQYLIEFNARQVKLDALQIYTCVLLPSLQMLFDFLLQTDCSNTSFPAPPPSFGFYPKGLPAGRCRTRVVVFRHSFVVVGVRE